MRFLKSRRFTAKADLVSKTLVYPMTLTGDQASTALVTLTEAATLALSDPYFDVYDSSGAIKQHVGFGGFDAIACDVRAYNAAGTAYAAMNGSQNPACFELPDGTSAQGSKLWSGSGAPAAGTVGAATAGDFYLRRFAAATAATLVAASITTGGAQATLAVGSGTLSTGNTSKLKDGVPVAGDLLIFVQVSSDASSTLAVTGGDSGITATATDGGLTQSNGTQRVRMFSRVIQAGDISANQIISTPSVHSTGTGRRLAAYVFRHDWGWPTTGSLHGCALNNSTGNNSTGGADSTLTVVGPAGPTVALAGAMSSAAPTTPGHTYVWDAGSTSDKTSDLPGGANINQSSAAAKPSAGTNTSGASAYTTGGSSVVVSGLASATATALGMWQPNTSPPTGTTLYTCTAGGSPGTWQAVL